MLEDDFLIRQINQLAAAVAQRVADRPDAASIHDAVRSRVGLDPGMAGRLPPDTVVDLLTTADGLEAERALILGLSLAWRSLEAAEAGRAGEAAREGRLAARLLDAAVAARPDLADDDVRTVRGRLPA